MRVAPWLFGATLALAIGLAAYTAWNSQSGLHAVESPQVARGRYLVTAVAACTRCHGDDLAGGQAFSGTFRQLDSANLSVGVAGVIHAPNLTPDAKTGLGSWTDQQIFNVFRNGVDKNGKPLQGPMPLSMFSGMSDEDLKAIIAYLRALPAVDNAVPANVIAGTIGNPQATQCIHCHTSDSILGRPATSQPALIARGVYLVNYAAACVDCHTPRDPNGGYDAYHYMAGGVSFTGPWGTSYSADLTSSSLRSWSDADLIRAIQQGIAPDGHHLAPPMPYSAYAHLSSTDIKAIIAYLRALQTDSPTTMPGMPTGVPSPSAPPPQTNSALAPAAWFPAFAFTSWTAVLQVPGLRLRRPRHGRRARGMPSRTSQLSATPLRDPIAPIRARLRIVAPYVGARTHGKSL